MYLNGETSIAATLSLHSLLLAIQVNQDKSRSGPKDGGPTCAFSVDFS